MGPQSIVDMGNTPYRGLRPYLISDAPFFFGREREVKQLIASAFASPMTLVYGPSGVGKSSVLSAGMMHEVGRRGDLLGIVYNEWSDGGAMATISDRVREAAVDSGAVVESHDEPLAQLKLVGSALEQQERERGALRRPVVIVLDQFEDYTKYRDRSPGFDRQFVELVTALARSVSIIVSIREDNVTLLDQFKGEIPNLFDNYLRIAYLDRTQAKDAIVRPLTTWAERHAPQGSEAEGVESFIDADLIPRVLDDVSVGAGTELSSARQRSQRDAGRIETAYLQLVMATLWEHRDGAAMSSALYDQLGGAREISRNHVTGVMDSLTERERQLASLMIPHLVTASGLKLAQHAEDISERIRRDPADLAAVLSKLEESGRILRVLDPPDTPDNRRRYEPYHDRIAEALILWKDLQDAHDPTERYRRRLRNQVTAAVASAKENDQSRSERGIERLGVLATQSFDREIADQALDALGKVAKDSSRSKQTRDQARELVKFRNAALVDQIAGEIRGTVSNLGSVLGVEFHYDPFEQPPVRYIDDAALRADIDDVVSLTMELDDQLKGDDELAVGSRRALEDLHRDLLPRVHLILEALRERGLVVEAMSLEKTTTRWYEPDIEIEYGGQESPLWLRLGLLTFAALGGSLLGELVSSWWLERSGRLPLDDVMWPFLVFALFALVDGWVLAWNVWQGELLRDVVAWFFTVPTGWIVATSMSLMISATFSLGFFWPLWILTVALGLIGVFIAQSIADM